MAHKKANVNRIIGNEASRYCKISGCDAKVEFTHLGELVRPEQFSCKNSFYNPQFPQYVCCRLLKFNDGADGEGSLCMPYRKLRRGVYLGNPKKTLPGYVAELQRRARQEIAAGFL